MKPIDQLKSILNTIYESSRGEKYQLELFNGMTDREIEAFREKLPNHHLPKDIEEILRYTKGFSCHDLEDVRLDALGEFGFEEAFPHSINLTGDGAGNFWILDISSQGEWKEVYYVCHDPAVIVKHSNHLSEFIQHIDEYGKQKASSTLHLIHEKIVYDISSGKLNILKTDETAYNFPKEFSAQISDEFLIADLTNQAIATGFDWAPFGANSQIRRFEDQAIWILEKA